MTEVNEASCSGMDDLFKKLSENEANFVVIGQMGFVRELGLTRLQDAIEVAREDAQNIPDVRLCVRTEEFGAVTVDFN